jgi:hypothetical protein
VVLAVLVRRPAVLLRGFRWTFSARPILAMGQIMGYIWYVAIIGYLRSKINRIY